jgi:hypothetical protein
MLADSTTFQEIVGSAGSKTKAKTISEKSGFVAELTDDE